MSKIDLSGILCAQQANLEQLPTCEGNRRAARPDQGHVYAADVLTRDNPHLSRPKTPLQTA
jgi:hypothetical protein